MPTTRSPRKGSLQFRPRVRAKRPHARVRSWATVDSKSPLGFAGFKAGMTHVIVVDNVKNSLTKGKQVAIPVTIIECPPIKIGGIRFYAKSHLSYGELVATEVHFKPDKFLPRRVGWKASGDLDSIDPEAYTRATLLVYTQPSLTGIGQKTPHVFEVGFGGSVKEAIDYVKENTEFSVSDILKPGMFVDAHGVTKGKGTAGPVKRFGISLRSHKSEKSNRKAVLGPEGYAKVQFTAPQAGKLGYHLRTEYNKQVIAIVEPEQVRISGGLVNYGNPKNTVVLVRGSVPGPKKRLITLTHAIRPNPKASVQPPQLIHISTRSQQGNQ